MLWRMILVGLLLVLAAPAGAHPADPVLWKTRFGGGSLSKWKADGCGGEFNSGGGETRVTRGKVHVGRFAAALRLPDASRRTQGVRLFRWCEAQSHPALYYSAWYYLPRRYDVNGWWGLMQWKSEGSFNWKFGIMVGNRPDGAMYLYLGRGEDSGGGRLDQNTADLPAERWVHVEAYYEKAADRGGRVAVWQDGTKILDVDGVQTANSDDLGWAVINYGQGISPSPVRIVVDDARIERP